MLSLRPNCELCNKDLPPDSVEAYVCSYECTFCKPCVDTVLSNVCPNCGGGFVPRPIRPKTEYRPQVSLLHDPASTKRVLTKYTREDIIEFSRKIKHLAPKDR
ncbi:DUF1272 domain-containing protein [Kaarinaea lacus]